MTHGKLVALSLTFCFLAAGLTAADRVAQLSQVDGSVSITRATDGSVDDARQVGPRVRNGSVFAGDIVTTDPGAVASMLFSDGSKVELKEKTSLTVREVDLSALVASGRKTKPIGRTIKILAGDVWTSVAPNPEVATEFETPSGVAAVKGTEFTISVAEEDSEEEDD